MKHIAVPAFVCVFAYQSLIAQQPQQSSPTAATKPTSQSPTVSATASVPAPNILLDGTAVQLRLSNTLSSADAQVGQQVPLEVTQDVLVQGAVVITKGSAALATVTTAESKKRMGRGGKLDVRVDSVRLVDGENAQLRAIKDAKGGGHVGVMTGAMVATGLVFLPAAPLFLFMHGKDITIPKGTAVTAFVQGDMHLDMSKFDPTFTAPSAVTQNASLVISSNVEAADIEIDGNFVGSTPSTLSIASGQHTVVVKKKGYSDWTKAMNVSGSSVHLNADLSAQP